MCAGRIYLFTQSAQLLLLYQSAERQPGTLRGEPPHVHINSDQPLVVCRFLDQSLSLSLSLFPSFSLLKQVLAVSDAQSKL